MADKLHRENVTIIKWSYPIASEIIIINSVKM